MRETDTYSKRIKELVRGLNEKEVKRTSIIPSNMLVIIGRTQKLIG